ncbi:hypothetical protein [Lysobacter enzymogenes]|uniref:hypothetical protein n=1 Tax=Lysobacter enzymogenes TaxID=69 RepID=UPI0022656AAE|nr:hypothetical protein [Lysobacter enzymogenes]UZW60647.1 hypothetical protein BV903_025930 [Lysobacter enzymogenes]
MTFLRSKFRESGLHYDNYAIPDISVGVVLLTGQPIDSDRNKETLATLRVQDHLRRMGLGLAFMHDIVAGGIAIDEVLIAKGDYGQVSPDLTTTAASKHQRRLQRFLVQARLMADKSADKPAKRPTDQSAEPSQP